MISYKLSGIVKAEWDYNGEAGIFSFVINSLCFVKFGDYKLFVKMKTCYVRSVYADEQRYIK